MKHQGQYLLLGLLEKHLVRETHHLKMLCTMSQTLSWMPDTLWWIGRLIRRNLLWSLHPSMGDGHLVHNNIINYLITIVNVRESGGRGGDMRVERTAKQKSWVKKAMCGASGTEGGWCGSSMDRERQRSALNWGWTDRQEPEQIGPFASSPPPQL